MSSTVPRADHRALGGAAAPAADWNDRLAAARSEEFAELFHEAVTQDRGAVAQLHQMLETASQWCRAHGARSSALELDALADRLTDLGEKLYLVGEDMGHDIHTRSHQAAAATRISPIVSARGTSVGHQSDAPAPFSPPSVRSLPCSR